MIYKIGESTFHFLHTKYHSMFPTRVFLQLIPSSLFPYLIPSRWFYVVEGNVYQAPSLDLALTSHLVTFSAKVRDALRNVH